MKKHEMVSDVLKQLNDVVSFVFNNRNSDFYRNKYNDPGIEGIDTWKDFYRIPPLSKDEVITVPLSKRIFVNHVDLYSFTSGTTNQNKILVIPHIHHTGLRSLYFDKAELKRLNVKNFLILTTPSMGIVPNLLSNKFESLTFVLGDISKLDLTFLNTKEINVSGIVSTPSIAEFFRESIDDEYAKGIRYLLLTGEICSQARLGLIKKLYPKATIHFAYGSAEVGGHLGYQCSHLVDKPNIYHASPFHFLEVTDEGELLVTDLSVPSAFPLIRYKTGDKVELSKVKCLCGNNNQIELKGRLKADRFKINGLVITVEALEYSLRNLTEIIAAGYQLIIDEKVIDDKIMPQLELRLSLLKHNGDEIELIRNEFMDDFYLARNKNLNYFVENKIFLPPIISIHKTQPISAKTARIIYKPSE